MGDEGTGAENPGSVILNIVANSLLAICKGSFFAMVCSKRAVLFDKMLCCLRRWSRDRLGGSLSAVVAAGPRRLRLNPNAYEINHP